jgi:hypothetical protein
MDTLFVFLIFSILTNFLLFRWGVHEYRARRQWQQEAVVLERALRNGNSKHPTQIWGLGFWIVGAILVAVAVLTSFL